MSFELYHGVAKGMYDPDTFAALMGQGMRAELQDDAADMSLQVWTYENVTVRYEQLRADAMDSAPGDIVKVTMMGPRDGVDNLHYKLRIIEFRTDQQN